MKSKARGIKMTTKVTRIDLSAIPTATRDRACVSLLDATRRAFENPETLAAFRKWKKEKKREKNK